ncbi:ABC transporter ATP-binding protein [Candidatus Woesearchaeota archaeon]|nr:ABC transporter ATP-binding protein [Candidatus Woesearchaeota archaeon]
MSYPLLRKIFLIMPEVKKGFLWGVFIALIFEIIKFIPIILIKEIIDGIVQGQTIFATFLFLLLGVLAAYIAMAVMDYFTKNWENDWIIGYEVALLQKAKQKLLDLPLEYHESRNTGAQVSKITKGAQKLGDLLWFAFNEFLPSFVQMFLTVGLLLYEQWLLAAIFAVFLPFVVGITLYEGKKVQPLRQKYHSIFDHAVGELGESLFNIATVKDYVQEKKQLRAFRQLLQRYRQTARVRTQSTQNILIWRDLLVALGRIATFSLAVFMVVKGTITPGSLVLVYTLTERAFLSTFRIGRLYSHLGDAMESIDRLAELVKLEPALKDAPHAWPVRQLAGNIEFRDVTFSYGKKEPALHHVSLAIPSGKIVALVGRSGSGKTTFVKVLLRNYDVSSGAIRVDGQDLRAYKMHDYKSRIAVVSQQVEIFNRTVLENIRFAKPYASQKEVVAAAQKAHAHEFIRQFPQGYETLVGEKGIRLSGGQKQRISIARALLKDPDIYIFDEATSSLDSESERFIQESIFSLGKRKTTIIIAHRLSTIRRADLIVVLDQGKVVETGSYTDLLKKPGPFARMVRFQETHELRE